MNTIIALWSSPRSLSTAFERMMIQRGDFKVFHEPFSYFYYLKEQAATAVGLKPDPDHPVDFSDTLAMIQSEAEKPPVFFKDMSYYVIDQADNDFLGLFMNTFITRDPALALVSHYKINPDFTLTEAGYIDLHRMFDRVVELTGKVPPVVDAADLAANPHDVISKYCQMAGISFMPEALTWDATLPPQWETWQAWHVDAVNSSGFVKDMEPFDFTVHEVPRLADMYESCRPHYEALYRHRIRA